MPAQTDGSELGLLIVCLLVMLVLTVVVFSRMWKASSEWVIVHEGVVSTLRDSVIPGALRPIGGGIPTVSTDVLVVSFEDGKTLRLPRACIGSLETELREGERVRILINGNGKFSIRAFAH